MSNERRLLEYLPPVLQGVREFKGVAAGEEPELRLLWGAAEAVRNDQFVMSATENGILRYEKLLDITPKSTFNLDERRFTILTRLNEQLPFTLRMLNRMLAELCGPNGYTIYLDTVNNELYVKIALTAVHNYDDVERMLRRVCPANLFIVVIIMYNKHQVLSQFTHSQLAAYSHDQLRNEVFDIAKTHRALRPN